MTYANLVMYSSVIPSYKSKDKKDKPEGITKQAGGFSYKGTKQATSLADIFGSEPINA